MKNEILAERFWLLGQQFLTLANASAEKLIENNNILWVTSTQPISTQQYNEDTKWSDHSISIPILFNFYHGMEVMLKGFLLFKKKPIRTHKFSVLIKRFEEVVGDHCFLHLVKKHTIELDKNSIVSEFNQDNSITIDDWYLSLKYPEISERVEIYYSILQFNEEKTLGFWQTIADDSLNLIKLSRKFQLENTQSLNSY